MCVLRKTYIHVHSKLTKQHIVRKNIDLQKSIKQH